MYDIACLLSSLLKVNIILSFFLLFLGLTFSGDI